MHLLNARTTTPDDAGEAVDLAQSPGDIVFLSAADTELACLAAAQAGRPADAPSLRLANLLQLGHPMSVDLYVEQVIAKARLVILRLLGGRSYWPYGLEQIAGACRARSIPLAVLPGDDNPDPELVGLEHAAGRGLPSAVAVRRARRPRQRAAASGLCREPARPRRALARAGTAAARRALLAGPGAARPRHDPRPLAAGPAGRGRGVLPRPGAGGRSRRDRRA